MESLLYTLLCSFLLLGVAAANDVVKVGDEICVEGLIMDYFCINLGFMLDSGKTTLEQPATHTVHCLVDVRDCRESPFEVLIDPVNGGGGLCIARNLSNVFFCMGG